MKLLIIAMILTLTLASSEISNEEEEDNFIDLENPEDPWVKTRILSMHCVKNPTQYKVREYFKKYPGSFDIHGIVDGISMACVTAEDIDLYNYVMEEREPIINGVQCYKLPCPKCFTSERGCKQKR